MTTSKTAIVTGASSAIGAAIATALADTGYHELILHCHTRQAESELLAETLQAKHPQLHAKIVVADFGDPAQIEQLFATIIDAYPVVDLLVNNAGVALQKLLPDTTLAEWERVFTVNVTAAFLASKAVLPSMIARKKGKLIHIGSMWGVTGASCEVAYSASKAALIGFTKSLAKEVAPSGITVNCVAPGAIATGMTASLGDETVHLLREEIPLGRIGYPEEVAHAVAFLASPQADYITGENLNVNGGMVI